MLGKIKPLLIVKFNSAVLSGGNRRTYEILRLGKSEGIDYIVVTDPSSIKNAIKMFPDYAKVLSNYRVYLKDRPKGTSKMPGLKQAFIVKGLIDFAAFVSRVIEKEKADLVVGSEEPTILLESFISARYCGKPWTTVFQPTSDILQPSPSFCSVNAFNVLKFVSRKASTKNLSLLPRIGLALELLIQLLVAGKSPMLSVSSSLVEDFNNINPRIKFIVINPGNGLRTEKFSAKPFADREYDAIFFARLVPEKGLYDLIPIWKEVMRKAQKSMLAVAGVVEDQRYVDNFLEAVKDNELTHNILLLGELDEVALIRSVKSAKLTLYPSSVDSFSLVTLESLACGTPVVAYDIPAIRHNFGKCEAVLRCQPKDFQNMADKTVLILKNETLRSELKNKAREYSQRYTWSNVAKAEKEAYLKVVNTFKMPHCFFQNCFSQKGKKQASPFKESDVDRMNPGS